MYDVLGLIYEEMVRLFSPLELFHFGGDEVRWRKERRCRKKGWTEERGLQEIKV